MYNRSDMKLKAWLAANPMQHDEKLDQSSEPIRHVLPQDEIHQAAELGDLQRAKDLYAKDPSCLNRYHTIHGTAPLCWAFQARKTDVAKFFLAQKDIELVKTLEPYYHFSPLFYLEGASLLYERMEFSDEKFHTLKTLNDKDFKLFVNASTLFLIIRRSIVEVDSYIQLLLENLATREMDQFEKKYIEVKIKLVSYSDIKKCLDDTAEFFMSLHGKAYEKDFLIQLCILDGMGLEYANYYSSNPKAMKIIRDKLFELIDTDDNRLLKYLMFTDACDNGGKPDFFNLLKKAMSLPVVIPYEDFEDVYRDAYSKLLYLREELLTSDEFKTNNKEIILKDKTIAAIQGEIRELNSKCLIASNYEEVFKLPHGVIFRSDLITGIYENNYLGINLLLEGFLADDYSGFIDDYSGENFLEYIEPLMRIIFVKITENFDRLYSNVGMQSLLKAIYENCMQMICLASIERSPDFEILSDGKYKGGEILINYLNETPRQLQSVALFNIILSGYRSMVQLFYRQLDVSQAEAYTLTAYAKFCSEHKYPSADLVDWLFCRIFDGSYKTEGYFSEFFNEGCGLFLYTLLSNYYFGVENDVLKINALDSVISLIKLKKCDDIAFIDSCISQFISHFSQVIDILNSSDLRLLRLFLIMGEKIVKLLQEEKIERSAKQINSIHFFNQFNFYKEKCNRLLASPSLQNTIMNSTEYHLAILEKLNRLEAENKALKENMHQLESNQRETKKVEVDNSSSNVNANANVHVSNAAKRKQPEMRLPLLSHFLLRHKVLNMPSNIDSNNNTDLDNLNIKKSKRSS